MIFKFRIKEIFSNIKLIFYLRSSVSFLYFSLFILSMFSFKMDHLIYKKYLKNLIWRIIRLNTLLFKMYKIKRKELLIIYCHNFWKNYR